ncbi:MAG: N-acetylmuramoyl-L-alanine amidase [Planctomycetes bacterium]|nr:N-acetylmuramoyl-L-alanine amidase [Planctomycetota bacterium]
MSDSFAKGGSSLTLRALVVLVVGVALVGCSPKPGARAYTRRGDEIMIAGQLFHTGAPVVLWTDPGGYDAYRTERRFVPIDQSSWAKVTEGGKGPASPNRYDTRTAGLSPDDLERVRGGGWDLPTLQGVVDQFVIHYDVCGTSRQCFRILHDVRGLSVHFMLDIDGTIYQTLDVKERAWHATSSNHRSVGIEIANIGSYADAEKDPFDRWYERDERGNALRITIPSDLGATGGVRTPNFVGRPIRPELVRGPIQGTTQRMYDLTPQQYDSLTKLTAALCTTLPRIRCDYPRDANGQLITSKLSDEQLATYTGLLGHYNIQSNKVDPGPAFQWDRVVDGARRLMR